MAKLDKLNIELKKKNPLISKQLKTLKLFASNNQEDRDAILVRAYTFIDDYWSKFVYPHSSCKAGCSHCCQMSIQLTPVEAEFIGSKLHIPVEIENRYLLTLDSDFTPCPFLDVNGQCKIYGIRPFTCRTYFSFSKPSDCGQRDKEIKTISFESSEITQEVKSLIRDLNYEYDMPYAIIQSYFPFAKSL